jgi:hypothetical protein
VPLPECPKAGQKHRPDHPGREKVALPCTKVVEQTDPLSLQIGVRSMLHKWTEPRRDSVHRSPSRRKRLDEFSTPGHCRPCAIRQGHLERSVRRLKVFRKEDPSRIDYETGSVVLQ